jgi:hypothetical protein
MSGARKPPRPRPRPAPKRSAKPGAKTAKKPSAASAKAAKKPATKSAAAKTPARPPLISEARLEQAVRASRAGKPAVAYDPRAVKLMLERVKKIDQKRAEDRVRHRDSVTFGAERERLDRQRMVGRDSEASFETPQARIGATEAAPSGQRIVAEDRELKRQLTDRLNQARNRPQRRR